MLKSVQREKLPVAVFVDNDVNNFKDSSLCPRVVKILAQGKTYEELEKDPGSAKHRSVFSRCLKNDTREISNQTTRTHNFGDLDHTSGIKTHQCMRIAELVKRGMLDYVFLDFDRTLSKFEGFPSTTTGGCFRKLSSMKKALSIVGDTKTLAQMFFGCDMRRVAIQTVFDLDCEVVVLTNNPCAELIADVIKMAGVCDSPVAIATNGTGMTKYELIAKLSPPLKLPVTGRVKQVTEYMTKTSAK